MLFLPACHHAGPVSTRGSSVWDLLCQSATGTCFSSNTSVSSVSTFPPMQPAHSLTYHRCYITSTTDSVLK